MQSVPRLWLTSKQVSKALNGKRDVAIASVFLRSNVVYMKNEGSVSPVLLLPVRESKSSGATGRNRLCVLS